MKENLSRSLVALALGFLVALGDPTAAWAQSQATTAEVNGRVTDAQGGVLPGATVTVTRSTTADFASTVTNAEGLYSLPLLPPGLTTTSSPSSPASRPQSARSC